MRFITALLFCLWSVASAQESKPATLVSEKLLENYQPDVAVSGNVIVGVMTDLALGAIASDEIALFADALAAGKRVCLKASSQDGIYTSRNVYQLPDDLDGRVPLPYESSIEKIVKQYREEIALTATTGDCDSGSNDYYLISKKGGGLAKHIVVYLNSFGATDAFIEIGDSEEEACEFISEGRRTSFDFICTVTAMPALGPVDVTIFRERFGRPQPKVTFRIVDVQP